MRVEIPFVAQSTTDECGAACLAMALAAHGRPVGLEAVREVLAGAVDAESLAGAARHFGLRARGVLIEELEDLALLPIGSILHWRFDHFVVLARVRGDGIEIVDPAAGRRRVGRRELDAALTGVALCLEAPARMAAGPTAGAAPRRDLAQLRRRLLARRGLLGRAVVASALVQAFALAVPFLLRAVVDRVVPQRATDLLTVVAAGLAVVVVFHFVASMVRARVLLALRTRLDEELTLDFAEHLMDLPYSFFERRSAGDLLMRWNSNATVREVLTAGLLSGILDGLLVVLYLVLLFVASWPLALMVLALGLARVTVFAVARRRHAELTAQSLHAEAESHGYQVQMLAGIQTLKVAGAEPRALAHWSGLFARVLNVSVARGRLDALVDSLMGALTLGSPLVVLVAGTIQVLEGTLSLGTMLAVSALAVGFWAPLAQLVVHAFQLQHLRGYLVRLGDVLAAPREQERGRFPHAGRLSGAIRLDGVGFRYRPDAEPAVTDVAVDLPAGGFVGIVGPSGAGKSTLAHLLVGLYLPTEGRVLFDGRDLATLDLRSVREQVGLVPQSPYLFATSVRENIALVDPGLPLARVVEAARLAKIDNELRDLPLGYDTVLGAGGAPLSGGQRQRLALARALVHRPAILLLDEATSALDSVTEEAVQASLAALAVTRVVVAHRLSTVRNADLILVLDGGRVVEQGTYEELIAGDGLFRRLASAFHAIA